MKQLDSKLSLQTVTLIRKATKPSQWNYVGTAKNPADQASRGLKAKTLMQEGTWINGPKFLLQGEHDWPKQPVQRKESLQDYPEVKNTVSVNTVIAEDDVEPINRLIDYYSDWHKLKRSVAWILRLKETFRKPSSREQSIKPKRTPKSEDQS